VYGWQVLLIHFVMVSICMVLWRLLFSKIASRKLKEKRLAIAGEGQIVSSFIEEMARMPSSGFSVSNICISNSTSGACVFYHHRWPSMKIFMIYWTLMALMPLPLILLVSSSQIVKSSVDVSRGRYLFFTFFNGMVD